MERFATGFSVSGATPPGYRLETEEFAVTFKGVVCDEAKNYITEGFEKCYCWTPVMNLLLQATQRPWAQPTDVEESAEELIRAWIQTFEGWGLLSALLPTTSSRYFILSLAYTAEKWDTESGGEFSEEKVFDTVKMVYDNVPGKELQNILPSFGVWFEEMSEEESGGNSREKVLSLFFRAKWVLEVKFTMEKKRVNKSLLDLSAEASVQNIRFVQEINELIIPPVLRHALREKLKDADWERSYYSFVEHNKQLEEEEAMSQDKPNQAPFYLKGIKKEEELENCSEPQLGKDHDLQTQLNLQSPHSSCQQGSLSWKLIFSVPVVLSVVGFIVSKVLHKVPFYNSLT